MNYYSRRAVLSTCAIAATGGCLNSGSDSSQPQGQNVVVTDRRERTNADELIKLSNSYLSAFITTADLESPTAVSNVGSPTGNQISRTIGCKPQTPISRTESPLPTFVQTEAVDVPRNGGSIGQYRLSQIYRVNNTPIRIEWLVTVGSGYPIVRLRLRLTNVAENSILLDQDDADTHDGIQVISNIGLAGRDSGHDAYRFAIDGTSSSRFSDTPRFETHPAPRYVTVFDGGHGVTFGYIRGDTGPRMAVVDRSSVALLVNEIRLAPNETVSFELFGSTHQGGSDSVTMGKSVYETATKLTWE